jgi:hypothetical protein
MAMIHPLLRLAATEPHLLGDHVEAYAALFGEEVTRASTSWVTRIGLYLVALAMVTVGLVLVGVALLLASTLPADIYPATWGLIVVPSAPFVIAAICALVARSRPAVSAFDKVKTQLHADMAMLREVSAA